tara:strand:+ start:21777 stop:23939 length:2163 start_codon:yes stop_codon:yes gene_type:complete
MDVRLPNGKMIRGVPEGTTKEQIMQKAISAGLATTEDFNAPPPEPVTFAEQPSNQDMAMQDLASKQGPLDTLAISAGKGLYDVGRGFGSMFGMDVGPDPLEKAGYQALKTESPVLTGVGEAVGETMPFIPAAVAATPLSFASRVAAMTGIGATETGLASLGEGKNATESFRDAGMGGLIAGSIEAALPVFGRLLGSAYRGITGKSITRATDEAGNVIPEVKSTLEAAGINIDELKSKAVSLVGKAPKNADEAARLARFNEQGMPYTPGDITGEFAQRSKEARLLEVQDSFADPLRDIRTRQADKIGEIRTRLTEALGSTDLQDLGGSVKEGLKEAKNIAYKDRKALYDTLAEKAGYKNGIPLPQDSITSTIFEDRDFIGMVNALSDSERSQLNRMMVRYGIDDTPEAIEAFAKNAEPGILGRSSGIEVLTTKNAEEFNKTLNAMTGPTSSDALKGVIGKLKSATDDGFNLIDDAIGPELVDLKKAARASNVALKQDFSPQSVAGKLINAKRDGITPMIEASNVFNQLFKGGKSSTIEPLEKTLLQLNKTPAGKKAIGDLQSRFILDVIDSGFQQSNKMNGQVLFSGNQALRTIEKYGKKEMEALFKNKPEAMAEFKKLIETGVDITPSQKETVKGSGSVIINALNTGSDFIMASKLGPIQGVLSAVNKFVRAGADEREIRKLLKQSPELVKRSEFIQRELPQIAVLLGLTQVGKEDGENN